MINPKLHEKIEKMVIDEPKRLYHKLSTPPSSVIEFRRGYYKKIEQPLHRDINSFTRESIRLFCESFILKVEKRARKEVFKEIMSWAEKGKLSTYPAHYFIAGLKAIEAHFKGDKHD